MNGKLRKAQVGKERKVNFFTFSFLFMRKRWLGFDFLSHESTIPEVSCLWSCLLSLQVFGELWRLGLAKPEVRSGLMGLTNFMISMCVCVCEIQWMNNKEDSTSKRGLVLSTYIGPTWATIQIKYKTNPPKDFFHTLWITLSQRDYHRPIWSKAIIGHRSK